jgi:hypothetical protein
MRVWKGAVCAILRMSPGRDCSAPSDKAGSLKNRLGAPLLDNGPFIAVADRRVSGRMARAAVVQLWLVLAILAACLALPRPGGAVLLIPLFAPSTASAVHAAGGGRIGVLRSGWIPGSLLVRIDGDVPAWAFLRAGVLPLGAPALFCASAEPTTPWRKKGQLSP